MILLTAPILLLSLGFSSVQASQCSEINELDQYQKSDLRAAYNHGSTKDLGFTLAAIALKESNAGKYRLNYKSNDFGMFMINIETIAGYFQTENMYQNITYAQQIIHDDYLGAKVALSVLEHFKNRGYRQMLMSYNEGSYWKVNKKSREKAEKYAEKVISYTIKLRMCNGWKV
jgi:hypothetical protein